MYIYIIHDALKTSNALVTTHSHRS